uniref:Uncharacterized protein n=1 Tax=Saccharolobus islandicus TaxID=43080 RepID=Q0ZNS5_SACIS|nr:hypothetical protein [Sulfolobus islandicus]
MVILFPSPQERDFVTKKCDIQAGLTWSIDGPEVHWWTSIAPELLPRNSFAHGVTF